MFERAVNRAREARERASKNSNDERQKNDESRWCWKDRHVFAIRAKVGVDENEEWRRHDCRTGERSFNTDRIVRTKPANAGVNVVAGAVGIVVVGGRGIVVPFGADIGSCLGEMARAEARRHQQRDGQQ